MRNIQNKKNLNLAMFINEVFKLDDELFKAIASVNREIFVPQGFKHHAYALNPLPIAQKQFISSPLTVAKMTQYLDIDKSVDSILEIGCGSGYQAAVLSKLVRRVFTIERIEQLMNETRDRFKYYGYDNIHTRLDDGQYGWNQFAPYDRILFSASATFIPRPIGEQLKEGGILVAPIQTGSSQIITKFIRKGNTLIKKEIEACEFVPIVEGVLKK